MLTVILAEELGRYGVRVNAIVPVARTRMTEEVAGIADQVRAPADPAAFDTYHPANVSPVVAWLASAACLATGQVLYVRGGEVRVMHGWGFARTVEHDGRWTVAELGARLADLGDPPAPLLKHVSISVRLQPGWGARWTRRRPSGTDRGDPA